MYGATRVAVSPGLVGAGGGGWRSRRGGGGPAAIMVRLFMEIGHVPQRLFAALVRPPTLNGR